MLGVLFCKEAGEGDDIGVDFLLGHGGRSVAVGEIHDCCLVWQ